MQGQLNLNKQTEVFILTMLALSLTDSTKTIQF